MATVIIAFVLGVIFLARSSGSIVKVFGLTSTYTGTAFACKVAVVSMITVIAGDITSSPGPTPAVSRAACNVDVPELKATAYFVPIFLAKACSSPFAQLPPVADQD